MQKIDKTRYIKIAGALFVAICLILTLSNGVFAKYMTSASVSAHFHITHHANVVFHMNGKLNDVEMNAQTGKPIEALTAEDMNLISLTYTENGEMKTGSGLTLGDESFLFSGWFTDPSMTILADFSNNLTDDAEFYAKWERLCSLNFIMNGHGDQIEQLIVKDGAIIAEPAVTGEVSEFSFDGWYVDEGLTERFDFNNAVDRDLTLYAKWLNVEEEANPASVEEEQSETEEASEAEPEQEAAVDQQLEEPAAEAAVEEQAASAVSEENNQESAEAETESQSAVEVNEELAQESAVEDPETSTEEETAGQNSEITPTSAENNNTEAVAAAEENQDSQE